LTESNSSISKRATLNEISLYRTAKFSTLTNSKQLELLKKLPFETHVKLTVLARTVSLIINRHSSTSFLRFLPSIHRQLILFYNIYVQNPFREFLCTTSLLTRFPCSTGPPLLLFDIHPQFALCTRHDVSYDTVTESEGGDIGEGGEEKEESAYRGAKCCY
jgi:hypothetical protein